MHEDILLRLTEVLSVPFNDTLQTLMLLNEEPIFAIASEPGAAVGASSSREPWCHLVRTGVSWPAA